MQKETAGRRYCDEICTWPPIIKGKLAEMQAILARAGRGGGACPPDLGIDCGRGGDGHHLRRERRAEGQGHHARPAACPPSPTTPACAWTALNGAPGRLLRPLRRAGLDDAARYRLLLQNHAGRHDPRRPTSTPPIVCAFPNGDVLTAEGDCHGTIAFAPMGEGGFGYDPVFFVPALRKTFAQLTAEEKNAISHRGNALRAFAAELKDVFGEYEHGEVYGTDKQAAGPAAGPGQRPSTPSSTWARTASATTSSSRSDDALEARELIKGRVLENSMLTAREAAEELAVATRSEVVQVIGSKFVLYRMQHDKTRRKIELVKARAQRTA